MEVVVEVDAETKMEVLVGEIAGCFLVMMMAVRVAAVVAVDVAK